MGTGHTVITVRISRSFLWYAMNELMHVMQEQIDAMQSWSLGHMEGYPSHFPWLNHGCKIECPQ